MSTSHLRTVSRAALLAVVLSMATAVSVWADVVVNEWQPWGSVNFTNNNCNPGAGLIDLFGEYHRVVIEQHDGTLVTHIWQHLVGTDASGRRYQHLTTIVLRDPPGAQFSSVVMSRLVSLDSTDNYLTTATFTAQPPSFDVEIHCVG